MTKPYLVLLKQNFKQNILFHVTNGNSRNQVAGMAAFPHPAALPKAGARLHSRLCQRQLPVRQLDPRSQSRWHQLLSTSGTSRTGVTCLNLRASTLLDGFGIQVSAGKHNTGRREEAEGMWSNL